MPEIITLYNNLRQPVKTAEKHEPIPNGLNKLAVHIWFVNDKGEYLLQQRVANAKKLPNMWGQTGGGAQNGETSWECAVRESTEELGITPDAEKSILVGTIKRPCDFVDVWLVYDNTPVSKMKPQPGEVQDIKWATLADIFHLWHNNKFIPSIIPGLKMVLDYQKHTKPFITNSRDFLGKLVHVQMDRPLGSKHPKHGFTYEVNYGFVPHTLSGDGEELDAYVLGVDTPVSEFVGKCVAVIHRTDDNDDKLVVAPSDKEMSDEYIEQKTAFQEKWFKHIIER